MVTVPVVLRKHLAHWGQDPGMDVASMYMPMGMPPFMDYRARRVAPPMHALMMRPELVKQGNQTRYKTELCRAFQDKGVCKYGEKCQVCS